MGTFQSGRFSVIDGDFSGFLFSHHKNPRPEPGAGRTHEDLVTEGSVSSRINNYLNPNAVAISGAQFGNLGRNVVIGVQPH